MPATNLIAKRATNVNGRAVRRHRHVGPDQVGAVFKAVRFAETTDDGSRSVGVRHFEGKTVGRWVLRATLLPEANEYVASLVLNRAGRRKPFAYGTVHDFATTADLARELPDAVDALTWLATHDEMFKCSLCKRRYLIVRGGFLCCEAMRGIPYWIDATTRRVACLGRGDSVPTRVIHPPTAPADPNDAMHRFVQVWLPLAQMRAGRNFGSADATRFLSRAWASFTAGASANAFGADWG